MTQDKAPEGIYSLRHSFVTPPEGGGVIYNPYANMHDPVETRIEEFTKAGYVIRGVVHVGANDGKELAWYITKNYRPVLAFEPHPQAFIELRKHYWNHALLWNLALGAENGSLKLNIPEDGDTEKSSKYKTIPTEGHDWTKVRVGSSIEIPLFRFDSWVQNGGIDLSPFNALVIDVQGMELEVLQGFGNYLDKFTLLIVECSEKPVYEGEASTAEVVQWLGVRGYTPISSSEEHGDVLFVA